MEGVQRFFTSTGKVDLYGHSEIIHIDALFAGRENGRMVPYIVIAHFYRKDEEVDIMIPIVIYSNTEFKNIIDIVPGPKTSLNRYKIQEKEILKLETLYADKILQKLKINYNIPITKQNIENIEQLEIVGENIEFKTIEIVHVLIEFERTSFTNSEFKDIVDGKDTYPFKNNNRMYFVGWYRLNGPNGTAVQYDNIEANLIGNCVRCDNPSRFIEVSEHGSTYCSKDCQIEEISKRFLRPFPK